MTAASSKPASFFRKSAPLSSSTAATGSISDVDCEDDGDDDANAIGSDTAHGPPGWPELVAPLLSVDEKLELVILLAVAILNVRERVASN